MTTRIGRLLITEFGIPMPADYGFPTERVIAFWTGAFDSFRTASDPTLGLPADQNRLVQAWCWFSLAETDYMTGNLLRSAEPRDHPPGTGLGGVRRPHALVIKAALTRLNTRARMICVQKQLSSELEQKLNTLPERPGVYIMRSVDKTVIYVGKAVVLRNRVRSYFQAGSRHDPRTRRLVAEIADLEWIVTDTELEALILENELIKRYQPRFNVRLRDDKTYPYLKIHWQEDFPKVSIVRRMEHDGARYYGPVRLARRPAPDPRRAAPRLPLPGLQSCDHRHDPKPCLYYHIKRCAGPCIGAIDAEGYRKIVAGLADFLEGNSEEVLAGMNAEMQTAAEQLHFERAPSCATRSGPRS